NWEVEFCRVLEKHPRVLAYAKNHNLGFEVPYRMGSTARHYRPDFIVLVDDGHGKEDPLHLIVEIKGRRGEDAKAKADTIRTYWIPAVNNAGPHGRWAVAEFTDVYTPESAFESPIADQLGELIGTAAAQPAGRGS